ncbi:hypothetical protein Tco_0084065 [Tanacetum coccineum]
MSRSSSFHTAHDASESGHTASLSRQPIQDSEEDHSEDEVNSIHSPTPTLTSVPSLPTCQGPPFRQTTRMRVISPTRLNAALPNLVAQFAEALNANRGNPRGNPANNNQGCSYKTFMSCDPKEFYGNEGAVGLLSWIEGMESKLHISKCSDNSKVEYAVYLLQVTRPGPIFRCDPIWGCYKYTTRFHELAKLVPHMVTPEDKRIDSYIWGLAPELRGMVTSANPSTIQSAVVLANRLTNDAIRSGV